MTLAKNKLKSQKSRKGKWLYFISLFLSGFSGFFVLLEFIHIITRLKEGGFEMLIWVIINPVLTVFALSALAIGAWAQKYHKDSRKTKLTTIPPLVILILIYAVIPLTAYVVYWYT